jgi:hypothetical protein
MINRSETAISRGMQKFRGIRRFTLNPEKDVKGGNSGRRDRAPGFLDS